MRQRRPRPRTARPGARAFGLQAHASFRAPALPGSGTAPAACAIWLKPADSYLPNSSLLSTLARAPPGHPHPPRARQAGSAAARARVEDKQVGRIQQGHRAADGQRHHHELKGVEHRGPARELGFDGGDKGVDPRHKNLGLRRHRRGCRRRASGPGGAQECQFCCTSAKACCERRSLGTSRGRETSPVRSRLSVCSNCASWSCSLCPSWLGRAWARRQVCMRMRPASLTAAAPPSNCQVTHSVRPMEASAINSSTAPMAPSLVDSEDRLGCMACRRCSVPAQGSG